MKRPKMKAFGNSIVGQANPWFSPRVAQEVKVSASPRVYVPSAVFQHLTPYRGSTQHYQTLTPTRFLCVDSSVDPCNG
jgi:hypothetical protein